MLNFFPIRGYRRLQSIAGKAWHRGRTWRPGPVTIEHVLSIDIVGILRFTCQEVTFKGNNSGRKGGHRRPGRKGAELGTNGPRFRRNARKKCGEAAVPRAAVRRQVSLGEASARRDRVAHCRPVEAWKRWPRYSQIRTLCSNLVVLMLWCCRVKPAPGKVERGC